MSKVYKLEHDYEHSGDSETDASHIPFKDDDKISVYFSNPILYGKELLPRRIFFQADFSLIPLYDFPLTDLALPIMSLEMIKVLQKIQNFEYEEVPVIMIDDKYPKELFDNNGELYQEVPVIDSYRAIRLSKWKKYFDYDKSIYRPSRLNPEVPGIIKKAVLKEPLEGFSPIFRMDRLSSSIFISREGKEALESAGIKGCVFEEVEVS